MQITINLPDNLSLTEADLRQELAVSFAVPTATHSFNKTTASSAYCRLQNNVN
ncbi:MAG: hypothetical protein KME13_01780 [Myxacorys californica WJT36-NPBG1]|jgi:hypothetical protein|nr:hypothetical protein [Myxacorys californica WJT36-NPBG1]